MISILAEFNKKAGKYFPAYCLFQHTMDVSEFYQWNCSASVEPANAVVEDCPC